MKSLIVGKHGYSEKFDLVRVIEDHFIQTEQYFFDGEKVGRIDWIKSIRFHVDSNKSDEYKTIGLLQVTIEGNEPHCSIMYRLHAVHTEFSSRSKLEYVGQY